MKKMNFTSTALRFAFLAVAFFATVADVSAQCKEKLKLYLDNSCAATLNYSDLVHAGAPPVGNVTIRKPNLTVYTGTLPYTFDRSSVFNEYEVQHMGPQGMCITYVTIHDNTGPFVATIPDVRIRCTELVNGKAPAPGSSVYDLSGKIYMPEPKDIAGLPGVLKGYTQKGENTFATDDCFDYTVSYEDEADPFVEECPQAPAFLHRRIVRWWTFKDVWGNTTRVPSFIFVIKKPITIPTPIDVNNCTADASKVGYPFIDWDGNFNADADEIVEENTSYCGNSVRKISESRMNTCGGSYMLMRQWKLTNCGITTTVDQVVNVNDLFVPVLSFQYADYKRIPKLQCRDMNGMKIQEFVYETSVERISDGGPASDLATTSATAQNGVIHKVLKVTPLVSLGNCNEAIFESDLYVQDPNCNSYPITLKSSDPSVKFNGMSEMVLNAATSVKLKGTFSAYPGDPDPFFYVTATDACGNTTKIKIIVVVIDNITPDVSCEDKQITLTNRGEALVTARELSDRSRDNCEIAKRYVRFKGTECWYDELVLNCDHIGYDSIDVRVIDKCGNYTDCCVRVQVLDKTGPTCPMSPDVYTECNDPRLSNLASFFTQPVAYDNCELPAVTEHTTPLNLVCGEGKVVKTWTFTDKAGNKAICNQSLYIKAVNGFRVTRLRSVDLTCAGASTIEQDKEAILKSIRNLDGRNRVTCSAPAVKITEMVYMASDFCKRIMRTYEVIDLCLYPGVTPPANDENCTFLSTSATGLEVQDSKGRVCWTRNITIYDNTPPVAHVIAEKEVCVIDATCAADFPTTKLTATDACNADAVNPSYLFYRWQVRKGSATGSIISEGNGSGSGANNEFTVAATATNNLRALPLGTYYLVYVVVDDCGNVGTATPIKVVIKDCKSPYINTHDKNTVLAYRTDANGLGQGMSLMNVEEVLNDWYDNCTDKETLLRKMKFVRASENPTNQYPATAGRTIMFTCADLAAGQIPVQVWTVDNAGNAIFNLVTITVEDNNNACSGPVAQSVIAGGLKTETNQAAANVTLTASIAGTIANTATTNATGTFTLQVAQGSNTVVKAAKVTTEDKYAGVTTFDIARISKHILDIENFTSAYQAIAADVNKDGVVDAIDMVQIRNFILRKSSSLPGGVWRFVDKSYTFRNPANPFGEDFPEVISLTNTKASETANFVAVKLGDVNANFTSSLAPTTARNSKSLILTAEDMNLVAGNEYTVNIAAENFNAAAIQGTFSFNGATVKSVKGGDLANFGDGNVAIFANEVTTSWNGTAKSSADVLTITFVANKTAKLSEVLTVGSSLTPAVANDAQGNEMNVSLKFNTGKVAGAEFALYQNTPNPVANETNIGFNMPKDGAAKLTIYNVEGKIMVVKNIDAKAGLNNVTVSKSELNASGVMYYRLETADQSATKKMIIIE